MDQINDLVGDLIGKLTELSVNPRLSEDQRTEISKDCDTQKQKQDERSSKADDMHRAADELYVLWQEPVVAAPPTPIPAPASMGRRYYSMDGLKPVTLSIKSSYFEWLEFRRSFTEWTQLLHRSPTINGPGT